MKNLPFLLLVDCDTLLGSTEPGTAEEPLLISAQTQSPCIYLISEDGFCTNDTAKPQLSVSASKWATILWSATCLGWPTQYNVALQSIAPLRQSAATQPRFQELSLTSYGAHPGESPSGSPRQGYLFVSTVLSTHAGPIQCDISFSIIDPKGKTLGHFTWSPFIKILPAKRKGRLKGLPLPFQKK